MIVNCPYCGKLTDGTQFRCSKCRWPLGKKANK